MSRISKRLQRLFLSLCLAIEEGSIREDSLTMWRPITYRPNAWRRRGRISKLEERSPPNLHFGSYLEGLGFHLLNTRYFGSLHGCFSNKFKETETHRGVQMLNASGLALFVVNKKYIPQKKTCTDKITVNLLVLGNRVSVGAGFGAWFFQVFFWGGDAEVVPKWFNQTRDMLIKEHLVSTINKNH